MINTIGSNILSSIKEYIDYRLLKDLRAFTNKTVNLYSYSDTVHTSKAVYGSPYATWVYNSGVSGVALPSGVTGPTGHIPRGVSGLSLDFKNGRVMFTGTATGISGLQASVSVSEINTYVTTLPEAKLIAETNFGLLPTNKPANTYLTPNSAILPALFFRLVRSENEVAAFSGAEWSEYNIRVTALFTQNKQLVAISDLIRDLQGRTIPLLSGSVLNELNDIKTGSWDYNSQLNNPSNYFHISHSYIDFVENDQFTERNPSLQVGIGTIRAKIFRFPRVEFP